MKCVEFQYEGASIRAYVYSNLMVEFYHVGVDDEVFQENRREIIEMARKESRGE